jgi:hypothetical protein
MRFYHLAGVLGVVRRLREWVQAQEQRIAALEARLAALEQQGGTVAQLSGRLSPLRTPPERGSRRQLATAAAGRRPAQAVDRWVARYCHSW